MTLEVSVDRWAAWAPGLEAPSDWETWARAPTPLADEGHPDAKFLPAMLRRRCTPLSRIVLTAAFGCCDEAELGEVRTVFASRHGSINESIGLLERVVRSEKLSPLKFSHTVHNAQAGLFSIAAGNRQASSSLSAREDTFVCGYLEALTHLEREPERAVLLVTGDVPLAPIFAGLVHEPPGAYALAVLLRREGAGSRIAFGRGAAARTRPAWPEALEFLRWLLSPEPDLELCGWRWQRSKQADS